MANSNFVRELHFQKFRECHINYAGDGKKMATGIVLRNYPVLFKKTKRKPASAIAIITSTGEIGDFLGVVGGTTAGNGASYDKTGDDVAVCEIEGVRILYNVES